MPVSLTFLLIMKSPYQREASQGHEGGHGAAILHCSGTACLIKNKFLFFNKLWVSINRKSSMAER